MGRLGGPLQSSAFAEVKEAGRDKLKQTKIHVLIGTVLTILALMATGTGQSPNSIQIAAKRYQFVPDHIEVKKGQPVTLTLHSLDVTHGLAIKELGIKTEIPKGRDTSVSFTPTAAGTFEGKCSHFCGSGHGSMKFTVVVTE